MKAKELVVNSVIDENKEGDVERIVKVAEKNHYKIPKAEAYLCWKIYSDDHANTWHPLPKDDKVLINIILRYCEVK